MIFLIGDFLEFGDFHLLSYKHELNCIIIRDRFEEDIKLFGEFNIIDTNSYKNSSIVLDNDGANEYNKLIKEHDKKLFLHLKKSNIKWTKIYTEDSVAIKLKELLNK